MMYKPYEFPSFPNVETRQANNPLRDGTIVPVAIPNPDNKVAQNTNPNPYNPESVQPVLGTQVFGLGRGYEMMPQNQDINHREIRVVINQPMLYRSNLGTPRVQSRDVRILAPSVTTPNPNATFGGKKGDVYGG